MHPFYEDALYVPRQNDKQKANRQGGRAVQYPWATMPRDAYFLYTGKSYNGAVSVCARANFIYQPKAFRAQHIEEGPRSGLIGIFRIK